MRFVEHNGLRRYYQMGSQYPNKNSFVSKKSQVSRLQTLDQPKGHIKYFNSIMIRLDWSSINSVCFRCEVYMERGNLTIWKIRSPSRINKKFLSSNKKNEKNKAAIYHVQKNLGWKKWFSLIISNKMTSLQRNKK